MSTIISTSSDRDRGRESDGDKRHPRPVHVTVSKDVKTGKDGQTEGMERQAAIVNLSPSICGTLMRAHPHSASAVHHHGDQDTIVYAVSGHGSVVTSSNDLEGDTRRDLHPGDWALIPAYREHQEVNEGDEEVVWVSLMFCYW